MVPPLSRTPRLEYISTSILNLYNLQKLQFPFAIGGAAAGEGNVISGNTGDGIALISADRVTMQGNFIGTQPDGSSPLPNGGAGVRLYSSTHNNVVGGINPGEGNIVAFNAVNGVVVGINNYYNQIRGNSIHDNTGKGISEPDSQVGHAFLPSITGVNSVNGTACANCTVDVYSDGSDEGRVFEGSTTANGAGNWTYNNPLRHPPRRGHIPQYRWRDGGRAGKCYRVQRGRWHNPERPRGEWRFIREHLPRKLHLLERGKGHRDQPAVGLGDPRSRNQHC